MSSLFTGVSTSPRDLFAHALNLVLWTRLGVVGTPPTRSFASSECAVSSVVSFGVSRVVSFGVSFGSLSTIESTRRTFSPFFTVPAPALALAAHLCSPVERATLAVAGLALNAVARGSDTPRSVSVAPSVSSSGAYPAADDLSSAPPERFAIAVAVA